MYRENIYGVMEKTGERITTLVVPKNTGLKGYAWKVLSEAGVDLSVAPMTGPNQLSVGDLTVLLRRGEDIPQIVQEQFERGRLVVGLTGDDLLDEYRLANSSNTLKVENTYDWFDEAAMFRRPTLCMINASGKIDDIPLEARIAINSKYKMASLNYLKDSPDMKPRTFDYRIWNGDVEFYVPDGTADCGIDTVYSGKTIGELGLKVAQKIRFSDLVAFSPLKSDETLFGRVTRKDYMQIAARLSNPTDSLTSQLLQSPEALGKKGAAEMVEFAYALFGVGKDSIEAEAADLLYVTIVGLVQKGKTLDDVARIIAGRQK